MKRLKTLWCQKYPEFDHMTHQQLRNHAEFIRRRMPQHEVATVESAATETTPATPPAASPAQDLRGEFLAAVATANLRTKPVHHKARIKADHLANMDTILAQHLNPQSNLWEIDCAVYAAASVLSSDQRRPPKVNGDSKRVERISSKLTRCRQEVSRIQSLVDAIRSRRKFTNKLRRIANSIRASYHTTKISTLMLVKQKQVDKIRALSLAKKRLLNKIRWIKENNVFRTNPSQLFKKSQTPKHESPSVEEVEAFWKALYEQESVLQDTPVLGRFERYCNRLITEESELAEITSTDIRQRLATSKNFTAPGPDGINSFWWKSFPSIHEHIARIFNEFLLGNKPIPSWLVEGRTVLIPKTGDLSNPKNYRPITCLNTLYKIFTGVLHERILCTIGPVWHSVYEQRGSKRGMAGCKDNLLVDRCVCHDAVHNLRNLSMAWVDYAKAFDTTSHKLIVKLLASLKVHPKIVECVKNMMYSWKTRFEIPQAKIKTGHITYRRGIFQGDSLSPLLFCISLLPLSIELRRGKGYSCGPPGNRKYKITHMFYIDDLKIYASNERELKEALNAVQLYSDSIGMSLGLDKCAVLHIKRGRGVGEGEDVQLIDGSILRHLGARETYKFLGVAQRGLQDATTVKKSLCSEYYSVLRRIWSSQLSGRNKVLATNMLAVPIISFTYGFLRWNLLELQTVDLKTRRILNINQSLHKKSSLQRIYLPRHQGGRGLLNMESLYHKVVLGTCIRSLGSKDPLMELVCEHEFTGKGAFLFQAARKAADIFSLRDLAPRRRMFDGPMDNAEYKRTIQSIKTAEQEWLKSAHMEKALHSGYFKQIRDQQLSLEWTFAFLRSNNLRSELEGFIFACQDGVIPTLSYRKNVLKEDVSVTCRACHQSPETLSHLVSSCPSYAATTYIYRHNAALRVLYYHLRHHYGIDAAPVFPFSPGGLRKLSKIPSAAFIGIAQFPLPDRSLLLSQTSFCWIEKDVRCSL